MVFGKQNGAAVDPLSAIPPPEPLPNLFFARCEKDAEQIASYTKVDGRWVGTTWRQSRLAVEETALGLVELGADKGTPIGILSNTRREWGQADLAIIAIGGITIGIYPTLTGAQTRQLLELSKARIVFVEDRAQRVKVEEACEGLEPPVQFVTMASHADGRRTITLDELRRRGAKRRQQNPEELTRRVEELRSEDPVSYIYTSGTTGDPKGAMLSHRNFHYTAHATNALIDYGGERALAFLPYAHSLQRYASYLPLITSMEAYFAESFDKVRENLREVRPTVFALVPRVLEKIHAKAMAVGAGRIELQRRIFDGSLGVMRAVGRVRREGGVPGLRERVLARAADRVVGSRIRERMGGRVKFIGSGGAPLARETHEFFEDIGIPILEGYGLTETCAPATVNTLKMRRIGTVGRPLPGTDVKIAKDGEILIRGPGVFSGYFENEAATKEAFDDLGWFKSGDIGHMSRDGFLTITDRKKDLIVTAGGKNIAPQPIENELKRHELVGQVVVLGDRRPYLTALIGIDPEQKDDLPKDAREQIERHIAEVNARHPSFEQVKRFEVLDDEMTIESGLLTPTLKVKRRVVNERYADLIERIYGGRGA